MQGICLTAGILAFTFQSIFLRLIRRREIEVLLHVFALGIIFYALIHFLDRTFYHASWHPDKSNAGLWVFQILLFLSGVFYIFSLVLKIVIHLLAKKKKTAKNAVGHG